eukprot:gene1012-603_t
MSTGDEQEPQPPPDAAARAATGLATALFPSPSTGADSSALSFEEFRDEYLRHRETFQSLFGGRHASLEENSSGTHALGIRRRNGSVGVNRSDAVELPLPQPQRGALVDERRRQHLERFTQLLRDHVSITNMAKALLQVLVATILLFQRFTWMGYGIMLAVYVAYKLLCFAAISAYRHFDVAANSPPSQSFIATLVWRYTAQPPLHRTPSTPTPVSTAAASSDSPSPTSEPDAQDHPHPTVAEPQPESGADSGEDQATQRAEQQDGRPPPGSDSIPLPPQRSRPPQHLVLLYCAYKCVETFFSYAEDDGMTGYERRVDDDTYHEGCEREVLSHRLAAWAGPTTTPLFYSFALFLFFTLLLLLFALGSLYKEYPTYNICPVITSKETSNPNFIDVDAMDLFFLTSFLVGVFTLVLVLWGTSQWRAYQVLKEQPAKDLIVPRGFTLKELEEWDGIQKPLAFMGIKGVVYSVSLGFYGKGSPYNAFAGRDCSRHLGKTVVGRDEANADWTRLSQGHLSVLQEWEDKLCCKYTPVGWVIDARDTMKENAKNLDP